MEVEDASVISIVPSPEWLQNREHHSSRVVAQKKFFRGIHGLWQVGDDKKTRVSNLKLKVLTSNNTNIQVLVSSPQWINLGYWDDIGGFLMAGTQNHLIQI